MLVLTLLFSSLASTTSIDSVSYLSTTPNAKQNCLRDVKCPETEAPLCVRVERSLHQEPLYIMVLNQCEMEYLKCYPSINAAVVSMKACNYENRIETSRYINVQKRIKRSARKSSGHENQISVIQFSSERQKSAGFKKLTEWSLSSLEEIENKVHFGFVVDVSPHMEPALPFVRNAIKAVLDMVSDDSSKRIKDMVLTVYVWPQLNGTILSRTEDADEFMVAVDDLQCVCNNQEDSDCEQDIYKASIRALERAVHHSHLFVFSNGPPSEADAHFEIEVRRLAEKKKIEVNFVVTGDCGAPEGEPFQSFYPVAAAARGQVLRIDKEHLHKEFLTYVNHTVMEFDRRVLVSTVYPAKGSNKLRIPFNVIETDDFVVVTVSGDDCDFVVFNYENDTMDYAYNVTTKHVKMYKYVGLEPGEYRVRVHPNELVPEQYEDLSAPVLVSVAVSSVEMLFKYGFSRKDTNTLKNTEAHPREGTPEYIIIAVREPKSLVIVEKVILSITEDETTYSLIKTSKEDIYRTKTTVIFRSQKVRKIKIAGVLRDAPSKQIKRISPRICRPYKSESSSEELTTKMRTTTAMKRTTTSYESYEITTFTESAPLGIPPRIDKNLENQKCQLIADPDPLRVYFLCILRCPIIEGEPRPEVEWKVTPDASADSGYDNKWTRLYGEYLKWIMRRNREGVFDHRDFLCRATNGHGEDEYRFKMRHVDDGADGKYVPAVEIQERQQMRITATEGDDVEIVCGLSKIKRIKWSFKRKAGRGSLYYRPLEDTGRTLFRDSVTKKHAGFYKCMPAKPGKTERQVIELVVVVPEAGKQGVAGRVPTYSLDSYEAGKPFLPPRSEYYDYVHNDVSEKKKLMAAWYTEQQFSSCPAQCPARDVMVCARSQLGVHRTFLTDCHMRMYQCRHPGDSWELVARRPCIAMSPLLDPPSPKTYLEHGDLRVLATGRGDVK